jgi:hypothetical protein
MAGQVAASNVARWNGTSWSVLGSGTAADYQYPARVNALAVSGRDLYAGGDFTRAGSVAASYVARWNGSAWAPLGAGMYGGGFSVNALAVSGSNLVAGGSFTRAGTNSANRVALWDGGNWSPMGSGMNEGVMALAVSGARLYAGGMFTTAGGEVSAYMARASLPFVPLLSIRRSGPQITISWPSVDASGFALEQTLAFGGPASWVASPASVTNDGMNNSVTVPASNHAQYFRLRQP